MLGSTVAKYLSDKVSVTEANRTGRPVSILNQAIEFEVESQNIVKVLRTGSFDYAINCIGLIKQAMGVSLEDQRKAIEINSHFPVLLSLAASETGTKIISIATDCVYSGRLGQYSENELHDPVDVYGKSKSLGEVVSPLDMTLRCSIIGKEMSSHRSLISWVINQPFNATIDGYNNHKWNGLTTLHFAKIAYGIIETDSHKNQISHIIPADILTKERLVSSIAEIFGRPDIRVDCVNTPTRIDRSLQTNSPDRNEGFWRLAGYTQAPSIKTMLVEYANWLGGDQNV